MNLLLSLDLKLKRRAQGGNVRVQGSVWVDPFLFVKIFTLK